MAQEEPQRFSLKDQLFNAEKVAFLGGLFAQADPGFDRAGFDAQVMARLPELELKQRIDWIAEVLDAHLPPEGFALIQAALPAPCDPELSDDDFGDFIFAPLGELVVRRGMQAPEASLDLLEEITQRFSMEYAIRPFLNRWPDQVLERMQDWAGHGHYHVRRLVSEGTRPKLPWGMKIGIDPQAALPLLDRLHGDGTRFVTRSVANHLNDVAKIAPEAVVERLEAWRAARAQAPDELAWMTRHALRTLVKAGEPQALALLGYRADADLTATITMAPEPVRIGGALVFSVEVLSPEAVPVLVDYVLHFHRPDGRAGRKVFKLKQGVTKAGHALAMTKRHRLKGNATTFRLYPGPHRVELQVNGRIVAEAEFDLLAEAA
ncbi:hypothetical protein [Thalassovita taeanensis]|uniref:3-methyladenine DNA glycosylase AlkC n=1 Tax=Thalassovita taeanensis TaxID=657014 RepID=A0A1H9FSL8_9RHOB|nr:hypothetical protein [Thalassovita taeanensis]SEQ40478.1 3-methyladenine DNA glycosylase AlkC [Thalassovita taeanensis]